MPSMKDGFDTVAYQLDDGFSHFFCTFWQTELKIHGVCYYMIMV